MSPSSLPLFPGQGGEGQLDAKRQYHGKKTALHPAKSFLPPQLGAPLFLGSGGWLAQDQREASPPRGRKAGVGKEGGIGSAALESREGGQESLCWSPVRVLPSHLHPEPSKLSRQSCDVGGRPPKATMRSPIPEACIPDLTLLCHFLAAKGLLFPSLSFCSDIAIPGLQWEPCAFKGLRTSAGFYLLGFRFGQD